LSQVVLDLQPVQTLLPEQGTYTVILHMDPRGHAVSGVDVVVRYDPAVLRVAALSKGSLLGADAADVSRVDEAAGIIYISLARLGPTTGPTQAGALASLSLTFRAPAGQVPVTGNTVLTIGQALVLDADVEPLSVSLGNGFDWKSIADAYNRDR
jgi:hypothetical protein